VKEVLVLVDPQKPNVEIPRGPAVEAAAQSFVLPLTLAHVRQLR